MNRRRIEPIRFTRGRRLYQIAPAYEADGEGFIGICDGRIVARGPEAAQVARTLIKGAPSA